jgi:hypothetical protein
MGRLFSLARMHWDHEPTNATLTPALSHRMGEGGSALAGQGLRRAEVASATQAGEGKFMGGVFPATGIRGFNR